MLYIHRITSGASIRQAYLSSMRMISGVSPHLLPLAVSWVYSVVQTVTHGRLTLMVNLLDLMRILTG